MGAVPAKCLQCKSDLRYDLASMRYRCPTCEAREAPKASTARPASEASAGSSPPADVWRERGEALGREAARLLHQLQRWLGR